ncbi:hypothetical protein K440DRAFT_661640 [Wilcoxina mikolae CBS 423.85]|nr:hypothetical protein K440DRAFT_661640 [Wilcoxina mikolae CBS 423.85]
MMESNCAQMSNSLIIANGGDVRLKIFTAAGEKLLTVSSTVLCLASNVFRQMLGPDSKFREATLVGSQDREPIAIEDDNYEALLVVLQVIHMRNTAISRAYTVEQLYDIAVICDKYDIIEPLIPWVHVWTTLSPGVISMSDSLLWLFVAWVFRKSTLFRDVSRHLIAVTKFDAEGEFITDSGHSFPDVIPYRLVDLCVSELDMYHKCKIANGNVCQLRKKRNECDSMGLGVLVGYLMSSGIWPTMKCPTNRSIHSVSKSAEMMEGYGIEINFARGGTFHSHVMCGSRRTGLKEAMLNVLATRKGLDLRDFYSDKEIFFEIEVYSGEGIVFIYLEDDMPIL